MATLINHRAKNRPFMFQEVICRELKMRLRAVFAGAAFISVCASLEIPVSCAVVTPPDSAGFTGYSLEL